MTLTPNHAKKSNANLSISMNTMNIKETEVSSKETSVQSNASNMNSPLKCKMHICQRDCRIHYSCPLTIHKCNSFPLKCKLKMLHTNKNAITFWFSNSYKCNENETSFVFFLSNEIKRTKCKHNGSQTKNAIN